MVIPEGQRSLNIQGGGMKKQLSDRGNGVFSGKNRSTVIPILTIALFLLLVGVSLYRFFYQAKTASDQIIAREVLTLVDIFKRIDKKCKIIDFDYQKNRINFLNIKSIDENSSEFGPMNVAFPRNWEGPYVADNPTIQGKDYQIVRTKKGYFITPGDGVVLSNGKVVGKDLKLDEDADIPKMMVDKNGLNYKGKALAAPLTVGTTNLGQVILKNIVRADDSLVMQQQGCGVHVALAQ